MTNREKFAEEKLSFAEVLDIFNKTGMTSFDEFLNEQSHKFKVGDIIVFDNEEEARSLWHGHKFVARIDRLFTTRFGGEFCYEITYLTPVLERGRQINDSGNISVKYADKNMRLY